MAFSWATLKWPSMGSTAEVVIGGEEPRALTLWAVEESQRLEACWSRFRPTSELNRVNRRSGVATLVSERLWIALERAHLAWWETGGLFDPTVLGCLRNLGYDSTFTSVASAGPAVKGVAPAPGFDLVRLDPEQREVTVPSGVEIDLGGIGKGLAADLIAGGLRERGAESLSIAFGGDVKVAGFGPHDDGAWMIPVESPLDDGVVLEFPLIDEAIVQSTGVFRTWTRGDVEYHHLIDPRTGDSARTGLVSVIVTGVDAWRAEAFAKAAFVAGRSVGTRLIEGGGLDGWFIDEDGAVTGTALVASDAHR